MKKVIGAVVLVGVAVVAVLVFLPKPTKGLEFRLAYSSRIWGHLEPRKFRGAPPEGYGGFRRMATAIEEALVAPRTFVVDTGGFYGTVALGTPAYREILGVWVLRGMDLCGVQVANVDSTDQVIGKKGLLEWDALVSFPLVSACIIDARTGEYVLEPFVVLEKDGLKVAFVGVLEYGLITSGRSFEEAQLARALPGQQLKPLITFPKVGEGLEILRPFEALKRVAPLLEGKADVVVVLGATGNEMRGSLSFFKDAKVFQLALSQSGMPADEPLVQGQVPIFLNGQGGASLGVIDCEYLGDGVVIWKQWRARLLDGSVKPHPKLAGLADDMRASLASVDAKLLVDRIYEPPGDERYVGAKACAACHRKIYEIWSNGPHPGALEVLKKANAQHDPACVVCHVSDYQAVDGFISEDETPHMTPITCELCHGRGSIHVEKGGEGADAQLMVPDAPRCIICHDRYNDPRFDYGEKWSKIQHGRGREPVGAIPTTPEARRAGGK